MIIQFIYAWLATYCFAIIFNVKGKKLFFSAFGGGIVWIFYFISIYKYNTVLSFFISIFSLTIYSEIISRYLKTVVTSILIPGLIPLVPGNGIYHTMLSIVEKKPMEAFYKGIDTLNIAGAITLGIIIISSTVKIFKDIKKRTSSLN